MSHHQPPALVLSILTVVLCLTVIFNAVTGISSIIKLLTLPKQSVELRYLCIITTLFFIFQGMCYVISITHTNWNPRACHIIRVIGCTCYTSGLAILYLLYLLRLRYIFKFSTHGITPSLFSLYLMGFVVQMCTIFAMTYIRVAYVDWIGVRIFTIVLFSLHVLCNVLLLCTFVHKFRILAHDAMTSGQRTKDTLYLILHPTIRYVICVFMSMICSNITAVLYVYRTHVHDSPIALVFHSIFITLDGSICLISLYLQYPFANARYERLCGRLHASVHQMLVHETHRIPSESIAEMTRSRFASSTTNATSGNTSNPSVCIGIAAVYITSRPIEAEPTQFTGQSAYLLTMTKNER
eukprot:373377_1